MLSHVFFLCFVSAHTLLPAACLPASACPPACLPARILCVHGPHTVSAHGVRTRTVSLLPGGHTSAAANAAAGALVTNATSVNYFDDSNQVVPMF